MESNIVLSTVVLCYRSNESIIKFANEVKSCVSSITPDYEIILVGNYFEGSNDITKELVERIAASDSHFIPVCKPKQGMMGWDMKSGLEIAKGKYICVIDGDGQFPVGSLKDCYNLISEERLDLVKSYREKRGDGFYRNFISVIFNFSFNLLFPGLNSRDINSKPKMFTKEAYDKLNLASDDWFIDAEIMIRARKLKLKIKEFPVFFLKLENRQSFVKFGALVEFVSNLFKFKIKEIKNID